jgi:hypothetical protein
MQFPTLHPTFFNATCKDWLHLLQDVQSKDIVINSLAFLVEIDGVRIRFNEGIAVSRAVETATAAKQPARLCATALIWGTGLGLAGYSLL